MRPVNQRLYTNEEIYIMYTYIDENKVEENKRM